MRFNPDLHQRQSIRLPNYDYCQNASYFITICTHGRSPLFGNINNGVMQPNKGGLIAKACWDSIPKHFPWACLGEFVVMPDHIHGVIIINRRNSDVLDASHCYNAKHGTTGSLGSLIRGYKTGVTQWFRANTDQHCVWQRNYFEHIIRNEESYRAVVQYIRDNPNNWNSPQ